MIKEVFQFHFFKEMVTWILIIETIVLMLILLIGAFLLIGVDSLYSDTLGECTGRAYNITRQHNDKPIVIIDPCLSPYISENPKYDHIYVKFEKGSELIPNLVQKQEGGVYSNNKKTWITGSYFYVFPLIGLSLLLLIIGINIQKLLEHRRLKRRYYSVTFTHFVFTQREVMQLLLITCTSVVLVLGVVYFLYQGVCFV